jgi:predicted small secreted protein
VDTSLRRGRRVEAVVRQRAKPHINPTRRRSIKGTEKESKMKKKLLLLWALLLVVFVLEGCATLHGIAEDIQSLGRGLKRTVSE